MVGEQKTGSDVLLTLRTGMVEEGYGLHEARQRFYLVDVDGLLGESRGAKLSENQKPLARDDLEDGLSLLEVTRSS